MDAGDTHPDAATRSEGWAGIVARVGVAVDGRGTEAAAAAARIEAWLLALPISSLPRLDRALRESWAWPHAWYDRHRLRSALPRSLPSARPLLLCLALGHRSGHVREAAIRVVGRALRRGRLERYACRALPWLVLRRNDWVDAVARRAARVLDRLLLPAHAEAWVHALPLLEGMQAGARRDHADFLAAVDRALASAAWAQPLLDAVRSRDVGVARAAVRRVLASPAAARRRALEAAFGAADPVVRALAARAALAEDDPRERATWLPRFEGDPSPRVRREALALRAAWHPGTLDAAHARLLFDRSRSLRRVAQWEEQRCGRDPALAYREALRDGGARRTTVALQGLAEVGGAQDAPAALAHLAAPSARRRAAAVTLLGRRAADEHLERLVAALQDPSRRVVRAAAAALADRTHRVGVDRLLSVVAAPDPSGTRSIALRLLERAERWAALAPLVRCAAEGGRRDAAWAAQRVRLWLDRDMGWTRRPPPIHVEAARRAVATWGARLPDDLRRRLDFLFETLDPRS